MWQYGPVQERRITGGLLVLLGALALLEARRLAAFRDEMLAGAVVGDDTFPRVVGAALFLLGLHAIFFARWPERRVELPTGAARRQLLLGAGALVAYCLVTPYLGYTLSTLGVSTGLYRAMGGYRWPVALLIGVVTTGTLHLLFRVWLVEPLPTGWIRI